MPDFASNRELKHYCPDFRPVRRALRALGARREPPRTQVDTYYRLPPQPGQRWRLKLRVERGRRTLVHYADAYDAGVRSVRYALADVPDPAVGRMLASALGVSVVVRKRREQWHAVLLAAVCAPRDRRKATRPSGSQQLKRLRCNTVRSWSTTQIVLVFLWRSMPTKFMVRSLCGNSRNLKNDPMVYHVLKAP